MTEPSRVKPWYKLSKAEWMAACKAALAAAKAERVTAPETPSDETK